MDECRSVAKFLILGALVALTCAASLETSDGKTNLLKIVEDVIVDVENSTQKVIRVNTVDLPPIVPSDDSSGDSSLYKIKALFSPSSDYVSSKKFRKQKNISAISDQPKDTQDSPIMRLRKPKRPKLKQLHMIYNQKSLDGQAISKRMKVRLAPGAYPIYYVVAKTNGEFRKQPIKGFRDELELNKYFDKVEKIGKLNAIGS